VQVFAWWRKVSRVYQKKTGDCLPAFGETGLACNLPAF